MSSPDSYQSILNEALSIDWQIEDLIGGDRQLDFHKPFLPDSLAGVEAISCLDHVEQLKLNQIRGNSYLHLFTLVEKFIIPMLFNRLRQLEPEAFGTEAFGTEAFGTEAFGTEAIEVRRSLLCFVEEESKHIATFQRFKVAFSEGFSSPCYCVEPIEQLAETILQYHPLAVLLLTLQFEWTTQSHYLESVRGSKADILDPQFCNLLKYHWLEEAQHTQWDVLLVNELQNRLAPTAIATAMDDYFTIVQLLSQVLMTQVELDLQSLSEACDRQFTAAEKLEIQTEQRQSYRWTFLCAGMTHPHFTRVLQQFGEENYYRVQAWAKAFSFD
jgi:hypothetical protein